MQFTTSKSLIFALCLFLSLLSVSDAFPILPLPSIVPQDLKDLYIILSASTANFVAQAITYSCTTTLFKCLKKAKLTPDQCELNYDYCLNTAEYINQIFSAS
ncbi:hypothetical protein P167DRAFT_210909 [Morchella conica CCBAS932]|uniref:Fungal calcium binding protein domain-containing protein n=1 Tax=Morchella conica CCBAS932 TaxID=1392247 RepID=A0A3N4KM50_9PEZI|nr:hypothetical protein P167DRAFT_210909 [Morchella conica CCBAS932]